jgi:hypothetical protein
MLKNPSGKMFYRLFGGAEIAIIRPPIGSVAGEPIADGPLVPVLAMILLKVIPLRVSTLLCSF